MDVLDDHPLLGLSLPAALHQQVHLLGAGARPLQLPTLRDAFNGLLRKKKKEEKALESSVIVCLCSIHLGEKIVG